MNDAPEGWQLGFQDSASPIAEGILRIHNEIQYYLLIILVLICWIITSIIFKFNEESNKFKSKYMNHGKIVPTRKGSKFKIYTTYGLILLYLMRIMIVLRLKYMKIVIIWRMRF